MRKFRDVGQVSQYSKTIFRICGMNDSWPLDGFVRKDARRMGLVGKRVAMVNEVVRLKRRECEVVVAGQTVLVVGISNLAEVRAAQRQSPPQRASKRQVATQYPGQETRRVPILAIFAASLLPTLTLLFLWDSLFCHHGPSNSLQRSTIPGS